MRDRSRDDRTVVVDPAGDQILQPLRGAAIGNEGDSDSDRRIQIRAWDPEAGPAELNCIFAWFAFVYAMNCGRLPAGKSLRVTSRNGCSTISATGAKSVVAL